MYTYGLGKGKPRDARIHAGPSCIEGLLTMRGQPPRSNPETREREGVELAKEQHAHFGPASGHSARFAVCQQGRPAKDVGF